MDTQSTIAIVEINELPIAINLSKGNLTRFEYPKLGRFYQTQEEFAEVHGLIQSGKFWKHLSAGDLPESKRLTVFDTPKHKGSKIFLNMFATCFVYERCSAAKSDPEAHKIAWALFAENVILSLKRNSVAWKRKVDAFRDTHGPINVITTGDSMSRHSMQANVKGMLEPCFMPSVIEKLCAKILGIQSNNKAKVLKNELKEKKSEFLNKRDALIRRETTASAASMIQTKITSLQTRYGSVKGANATDEQLAAVEAQITAMSNAVKLIEGDDKIANMKIDVESIEVRLDSSSEDTRVGITFFVTPLIWALTDSEFATCFVYERCSAAKSDPEAHKIAWALFAENVILSLKRNSVAWKRKVDAFRDTHGPINVITTGDSMSRHSMQANVKGMLEPCFMPSVIEKLCAKILGIQSNNKAKVLKNELKEKKSEFLNKRDALIRRETTASAASMIQTKITSLQTRYGSVKGANATDEQLAAVEAQITAMSNAVKLIEGDDKIANMKIDVESIEFTSYLTISCGLVERRQPLGKKIIMFLALYVFFENIMKQLANGCTLLLSPAFYAPEEGRTNRTGWSDAEAAHHMSFETGRGYTENAVGVEEGNVFYPGIASPGGAKKSWSDCKAAKNVRLDSSSEDTRVGITFFVTPLIWALTDSEVTFGTSSHTEKLRARLGEILPVGNDMPPTRQDTKKLLTLMGMDYKNNDKSEKSMVKVKIER
ncbi:hypothetical protein L7F22_002313 [Adiantum nelumboides]|nr:hypothetical protein [Adiantum nelumboides]